MKKLVKKIACNKKGSEVVEKILMVVVSLGIGAFVAAWIYKLVSNNTTNNATISTVPDTAGNPTTVAGH